VPNRLRGLATSVTFFLNVSLGVGLGPTLVALAGERNGANPGVGAAVFTVAAPVLLAVIVLFALIPGAVRRQRLKATA
jgi:hypothetical protein